MSLRLRRGARGEAIAAKHLARMGYTICDRNWRCRVGELDLVCRDGDTLVFVEVRTVSTDFLDSPLETIDAGKQRRVARTAEAYLRSADYVHVRFDVVGVVLTKPPTVEHISNAFTPPWAF